jgi:hypothetical protein
LKPFILICCLVVIGCSKQPDPKQNVVASEQEAQTPLLPKKNPQQESAAHLVAAKAFLESGDYDRGIEYLAKSIAVEGATNQEEAKTLLKDTIVKRNKVEALEHIAKTMIGRTSSPQPQVVAPKADWTAEQVLRAYLQALRWDYRLPFVLTPDEVRPLMEERYRGGSPPAEGFTIAGTSEQDGRTIIRVNLPTSLDTPFYLARTKDGYRVDWKECVRQWNIAEDAAFRKAHQLDNAVIEVALLKKDRRRGSDYTTVDFRITNKSSTTIGSLSLESEALGDKKSYLSQARITVLEKLSPGESLVEDVLFEHPEQQVATSFVFRIGTIRTTNDLNQVVDASKYFKLTFIP